MPRPTRNCVKDTNRRLTSCWNKEGQEDFRETLDDFAAPKKKRASGQIESTGRLELEKVKIELNDSMDVNAEKELESCQSTLNSIKMELESDSFGGFPQRLITTRGESGNVSAFLPANNEKNQVPAPVIKSSTCTSHYSQSQLEWSTPTTGLTQELPEETNKDLFTQRYLESVMVNFDEATTQIGMEETLHETLGKQTKNLAKNEKKAQLTKFHLSGDQNSEDRLFCSSVSLAVHFDEIPRKLLQDRFPW